LIIAIILITACSENAIYVSPTGNDNWSGTKKEPVATLQQAIDMVRKAENKKIIITEGTYYNVSANITKADSGLHITGSTKGKVKLCGGIPIGGWKPSGDFLVAEVPQDVSLDFRLLILNDTLRNRARLPEKGAFNHRNEWPHQWQSSQGGWSQTPTEKDLTTLHYKPEDIGPGFSIPNAELTIFHAWDDSYVGVSAIDTLNHILTFSNNTTHPPGAYASWAGEKTMQYIVWNIREGMTRPGQWFVDRPNRKVIYWPLPHETATDLNAIIPVQTHLIRH
jgi:hypothetical protein